MCALASSRLRGFQHLCGFGNLRDFARFGEQADTFDGFRNADEGDDFRQDCCEEQRAADAQQQVLRA